MTRDDLKIKLAKKMKISAREADKIILATLNAIKKGVVKDGKAIIRGFGCFKSKDMPPKLIHNPYRMKMEEVPAKTKVVFSPGKELRERVNL